MSDSIEGEGASRDGAAADSELLAEIVRQLGELGLNLPDRIERDSELRGDLGLTSLDAVDLVLALEDRYDIELEDEDVAELQTLGDVVDAVQRLR